MELASHDLAWQALGHKQGVRLYYLRDGELRCWKLEGYLHLAGLMTASLLENAEKHGLQVTFSDIQKRRDA